MILVILSWTLLFIVFLSFGEMGVRLWNTITKHTDSYSITDKFWIGICFVGTLLLFISIFAPLNIGVFATIVLVSCFYIGVKRKTFGALFVRVMEDIKKASVWHKRLLVAVFVAVLVYSLCTPLIYDEGLYHLQTMQWSEKYRAILGLGNVHGRLGFNSSFLLLSTVFNYHPSVFFTAFTINSICLLVFAVWLLNQIFSSTDFLRTSILSLVLLVSLFSLGVNVSSTSTDVLPNILIMYLLLSWGLNKNYVQNKPFVLAFVSMFCITLKLSSAVILLTTLVCLIVLYQRGDKRAFWTIVGLGFIVACPWLIRFVMLTGYLVYPFPAIDIFSVDWKIPIEMVAHEKDIAYAWARISGEDPQVILKMNFAEWFPIWLQNLSYYNLVLYILAIMSPILLIITKCYRDISITLAWIIAFLGVFFGLLTAPDFRFGSGFIVCAAIIPCLNISKIPDFGILIRMTKVALSAAIVAIVAIGCLQVSNYQHLSGADRWISILYKPQNINILKKKINVRFEEYKLNNTSIFVPRETNQCFDQYIPCAPYYNNNLEMRSYEIKDGFRIKK